LSQTEAFSCGIQKKCHRHHSHHPNQPWLAVIKTSQCRHGGWSGLGPWADPAAPKWSATCHWTNSLGIGMEIWRFFLSLGGSRKMLGLYILLYIYSIYILYICIYLF
jgi:hypothetical protein